MCFAFFRLTEAPESCIIKADENGNIRGNGYAPDEASA